MIKQPFFQEPPKTVYLDGDITVKDLAKKMNVATGTVCISYIDLFKRSSHSNVYFEFFIDPVKDMMGDEICKVYLE